MTRWQQLSRRTWGEDYAERYAAHFDQLAASGTDVHGEADFVASLLPSGAAVLDAGCGTGRVAQRLHERGFEVTGVDEDVAMVRVAARRAPEATWVVGDLAALDLRDDRGERRRFDAVVLAGNVVPFVDAELGVLAARLAEHLRPGALLVCGFGTDDAHLPDGARDVTWAQWAAACAGAGLELVACYSGWDQAAYDEAAGYVVALHTAPGRAGDGSETRVSDRGRSGQGDLGSGT